MFDLFEAMLLIISIYQCKMMKSDASDGVTGPTKSISFLSVPRSKTKVCSKNRNSKVKGPEVEASLTGHGPRGGER